MARQRYCRRLARYRNTLRVSADPVAKPAAHTRAESRGSRRSIGGCGRETDCLLEGYGFEPSVPRQKDNAFRDSSFPTCARATAAFENARRPSSSWFFQFVDPVRMNSELT